MKRFILLSYRGGCFKKVPKKAVFRHLYKMGRPPIDIAVIVSSTQDSRFVKGGGGGGSLNFKVS